ncbi:MAG TPA: hypothetical protein DHV80_01740, partial [Acidimicrobiaceae bacterium]|nr:hypothetical protein [Acidimicrobiaceae bacterium]
MNQSALALVARALLLLAEKVWFARILQICLKSVMEDYSSSPDFEDVYMLAKGKSSRASGCTKHLWT